MGNSYKMLVNHIRTTNLQNVVGKYIRGRLIDIGCGEKPYADMIKPYVAEHVGIDHRDTLHDKSYVDRFAQLIIFLLKMVSLILLFVPLSWSTKKNQIK